jgi:hypothetical protein
MTLTDKLVLQPNARNNVPGQLFGYPLIPTDKTGSSLDDNRDIMLINFRCSAFELLTEVLINLRTPLVG